MAVLEAAFVSLGSAGVVAGPSGTCDVIGGSVLARQIISFVLERGGAFHDPGGPVILIDPSPEDWQEVEHSANPIVMVTSEPLDDSAYAAAVTLGADAVVGTSAPPAELLEAIDTVRGGGVVASPEQLRSLVMALRSNQRRDASVEILLTGRERDILQSIDRGEAVKQTARALGISMKTVENLQSRLFRKLGVRNRAQAIAVAHALELVDQAETPPNAPLSPTHHPG